MKALVINRNPKFNIYFPWGKKKSSGEFYAEMFFFFLITTSFFKATDKN